ncbi:MAG: YybH family protein [Pirellulaceae bacterium]
MNLRKILSLAIVIMLAAVFGRELSGQSVEREIRDRVDAWCKAILANDVDEVKAFYLDSPETLVIVSSGDVVDGIEDIESMYQEVFEYFEFQQAGFDRVRIVVDGSSAMASGRFVSKQVHQETGDAYRSVVRTSLFFAKHGDDWMIIGEHSSAIPGVERVEREEK